ncbi:MAG: protein kinase, partial [Planctomycetes bacterium]|nr:protein kinase [Planctomycetota bacterium]
MPVDRALRVIADAAEGLAYAESLGIVHRDIKPDNLMLDQHGVIKIADLGLAGTDPESEQRAVGTPHFMAPEQVLRKTIDHRTDLYALGCTFYRLVTGRTPFRGQTVKDILRAQVKDDAEPAHKVNHAVPAEVAAIIQRLMSKEPADRYQTANALLEDVAVLLQPPHKKGLWIGLAAAAVLIAGGAIYWAVNKRGETVTEKVYYDDPEKQRFADENRDLKEAAREDRATIALLSARLAELPDDRLALALDKVADEHPDTKAAIEARQRATAARSRHDQREQQVQQLQRRVEECLTTAAQNIAPQVQAHDYALALRTLQAEVEAEIRDEPKLRQGLDELRKQVVDAARERLGELDRAIDSAVSAKDSDALTAALDRLSDNLAARGRWPKELADALDSAAVKVTSGRETLAGMVREVREGLWQEYHATLAGDGGIARHIEHFDFAAAAESAGQFATGSPGEAACSRAAGLAQAARLAEEFATALEQVLAGGELGYGNGDEPDLQIVRWDRRAGRLAVVDATKRNAKEQTIESATLSPEDWSRFGAHVTAVTPGARECFLALVLLAQHARAARAYLSGFDPADDSSGTGENGYPLASDWFDQVLRRLPDDPGLPWVTVIRNEIEAGLRLSAGLRALSERRNLAAATHLEKLLADHGHSYLVMVLQ